MQNPTLAVIVYLLLKGNTMTKKQDEQVNKRITFDVKTYAELERQRKATGLPHTVIIGLGLEALQQMQPEKISDAIMEDAQRRASIYSGIVGKK